MEQRFRIFQNYPNIVALLTDEQRSQSLYLSKLLAAVGAGLFDAALNYLWDETIAELRRRVARYDLAYSSTSLFHLRTGERTSTPKTISIKSLTKISFGQRERLA